MRTKSFEATFSAIKKNIMPLSAEYGKLITKEVLRLPEMHLSFQRVYPNFTPIIEKYREKIQDDRRFVKSVPYFHNLEFFSKYEGKFIKLEHFVFQISPLNVVLLLLEYIIVNPKGNILRFRAHKQVYGVEPDDYEIEHLTLSTLNYALNLLKKFLVSTILKYRVDATIYGLSGNFSKVIFGEYSLMPLKIPLEMESKGKANEIGLINVTKYIGLKVEDLIYESHKKALDSSILGFLWKDSTVEFAEFMGFLMSFFEVSNKYFLLHGAGKYTGDFIGSTGTFLRTDIGLNSLTAENGYYVGMAISSVQKGVSELNENDLGTIQKVWDVYFDNHVKLQDNVGTAMKRLGMSSIRRTHEDQLIDLIVGFESLIGIRLKGRNISDPIGLRASLLIKREKEAYEIISGAYRIRNSLLHSGRIKVQDEEVEDIVNQLTKLLGMGIFDYVELFNKSKFSNETDLVKHLDDSFFQAAKKLIHGAKSYDL